MQSHKNKHRIQNNDLSNNCCDDPCKRMPSNPLCAKWIPPFQTNNGASGPSGPSGPSGSSGLSIIGPSGPS